MKIVVTGLTIFFPFLIYSNSGPVNVHRPDSVSAAAQMALHLGSLIVVILSALLVYASVVENNAFQEIRAAFYAIPLTEGTSRIPADSFRRRMLVLGIEGILMAGAAIYLFGARASRSVKRSSFKDRVLGITPFVLCGAALMSYVLGCFLSLPAWRNTCHLYDKEGLIDSCHPVAFAISGIVIGVIAAKDIRRPNPSRLMSYLLMALAAALLLFALEEASWGQAYFGWQTPEYIARWNYQNETNLHNAFNDLFGQAYLVAGLVSFLAIAVAVAIRRRIPGHPISRVLPTSPIFWGAIWLLPSSQTGLYTDTEPFETIVAILIVYYAVNLWRTHSLAGPSGLDQHQQDLT